jgi:uncharacterized protein YdcH (DUF465 family)
MAKDFQVKLTVDTNGAVQNMDQFTAEVEAANNATVNLKKELRAIQMELSNMDPNDAKFDELSAKAGELKDRINDAAEAISANAGNAFESLGNNAQNLASRLINLDFEGVGQSARGMAASVKNINMRALTEELGGAIKGFAQLGKALLMNPIFAIGAAIALVIANFQELKGLVDGVSSSQRESLALAEDNAAAAQRQLDLIGQSENILRLQGKSEKEILQLKMAQTQAAIDEQKIVIAGLESIQQSQIQAAERNKGFLMGILQFITAPLRMLALTIDGIGQSLVDLGVLEKGFGLTQMMDEGVNWLANQVFDPEAVKKEGDATIQAAKDKLLTLENQLAGHQLSVRKINSDAAKAQAEADKIAAEEKRVRDQQAANQQLTDIKARNDAEIQLATARGDGLIRAEQNTQSQLSKVVAEAEAQRQAERARNIEFAKQNAANGLNALAALNEAFSGQSKKQQEAAFKRQKALNIAQALINTYQSATAAYASQIIPGDPSSPIRAAIAAGIAVASGLAQVKKISSTRFEGGGSSSGGGASVAGSIGGGANTQSGVPTFNPIDTNFFGNRPPQTAQAYVLAGHVSNAQDANEKVKNLARLG